MTHGQTNIKICIAKQKKQIFQYKKSKIKLYKTRNLCIKLVIIKKLCRRCFNINFNVNF